MKVKIVVSLLAVLILLAGAVMPACGAKPLFEVTSLNVSPDEVPAGQEVTVSATVENVGQGQGIYEATLTVDGEIVDTEAVSLAPGARQTVTFILVKDETGSFSIEIGGLKDTLKVVAPAVFEVTSLSISPDEVTPGQKATVSATVENVGLGEGTYEATLTVDGETVDTEAVSLSPGASQAVSFMLAKNKVGTYSVEIGPLKGALKVIKPAKLQVGSLKVTPALVLPGQEATVEADVANVGEAKGSLTTTLRVNGVEMDTRAVTLAGGATDKASFTVIRDLAGTYELGIDGRSAALTVAEVETYNSKEYYYSISYPTGWVLEESEPDDVTMVKSGVAALGITVNVYPAGTTLDEHYSIVVDNTKKALPDLKQLSRTEVKENGEVVAYDAEFTFTVQETKRKMRLVVSKRGRYGFARWGEAREAVYEQNKPLLDACLESFKPPVVAVDLYTNTTHGFSITLPAGWDGLETGERMPVLFIKSPVGEPLIYVYVYVDRIYEETVAKDYALDIAAIWDDEQGYKIVSQSDVTLGEATQGYEVIFTYKEDGYPIKRKVVSVIRGTQAFLAIVYTAGSTYDGARATIDRLTDSFTLVEPKPFGVSRQNSLFYRQGEIVTLDPALSEESPSWIVGAIFSGLVRIGKDLKVAPDIAEKWDVSDDGTVYTFYLRKNAKFHDGKPVTAYDFKYSWERACDPEMESRKARTYLGDIVGAKEILAGEATELSGVRVIDDLTLEVTIDGPKPYFLGKLAYVTAYVVDRANVARGINWTDKPNGTGPFELKEWKKDELLILERNENYYLGPTKLENVVFQIFAGRRMMMYEQGEIDIAGVYIDDFDRVLDPQNPLNKELLTEPDIGIGYLGFNITMPPFDDPKVRRAFALALDIDKILEVSCKGNAERSGNYIPPRIPGYNEQLEPLPFDPEQAKQLIAESKYGSVGNLPPIVFYAVYSLGPAEEAMIGMWQQNLGVTVEVQVIEELEEWYERSHKREFQIFLGGWGADYIDPQNFLEVLFHSESEENRFAYSNPEVDVALEEAAVEQDEEARLKMYQDIEKMILADLPAVSFYHSWKDHALVKPYVEGFFLSPIGIKFWREISIKPH